MIHLITEQKTINGKRENNQKLISQLVGFELKNYIKLPKNETFVLDGIISANSNFKLMKVYKNKKSNDFYLIQNNIIVKLICE